MRVFVSHSSKDAQTAKDVCALIEENGHKCFLAPRDIRSGYEYAEEIINGIDSSDLILLLLSEEANNSPHVLREIERAVSKKKSIIVYKLEEVTLSKSMEYFLMTHQWLNAKPDKGYEEIISCINEFAKTHGEPAAEQSAEVPEEKPAARGISRRKKIIFILAAAALLLAAAGTVTAVALNSQPQDAESQPDDLSASETSGEPEESSSAAEAAVIIESSPESTDNEVSDETDTEISSFPPTEPEHTQAVPEESQPQEPVTEPAETSAATGTAQTKPPVTSTPQEAESSPEITAAQVELSDRILFGTYNGEPIEWRVIKLSEDKTQAVVIANSILTMKAYDAAEGGEYNHCDGEEYWSTSLEDLDAELQRKIRGDNRWEFSNIRTWLNSDRENVTYKDQPPTSKAMSEKRNGYHTEAGFLNDFTKEELSAIVETDVKTGDTVTKDKVFLLSTDEVQWLYDADVSVYAKPTQEAVEQDASKWYSVDVSAYGVDDFFWWLRDANSSSSCEAYYVNISYSDKQITTGSVGLEGYGIRPAMTLDLTSDVLISILESANGIS